MIDDRRGARAAGPLGGGEAEHRRSSETRVDPKPDTALLASRISGSTGRGGTPREAAVHHGSKGHNLLMGRGWQDKPVHIARIRADRATTDKRCRKDDDAPSTLLSSFAAAMRSSDLERRSMTSDLLKISSALPFVERSGFPFQFRLGVPSSGARCSASWSSAPSRDADVSSGPSVHGPRTPETARAGGGCNTMSRNARAAAA